MIRRSFLASLGAIVLPYEPKRVYSFGGTAFGLLLPTLNGIPFPDGFRIGSRAPVGIKFGGGWVYAGTEVWRP